MSGKLILCAATLALALVLYGARGTSAFVAGSDAMTATAPAAATIASGDHASRRPASNARVLQGAHRLDRRPGRHADFERAPDLYGYVQQLAPAVRARQPDAIWMVSRAYDYCSGYAMAPAAYAKDTRVIRDMGLRTSAAMASARERISRRCARFAPADDLSHRAIQLKRVEAARAGSLPAEASLMAMGEPLEDGDAYTRDLVQRVQRSRDPEAYAALSPGMGIAASGRLAFTDQVAGTQFAELAWQLAGCRLGLDCGPESTLMTSYCAHGGICSRDARQDFTSFVYDAAIPRQGAEVVNAMVDSLVGEQRMVK